VKRYTKPNGYAPRECQACGESFKPTFPHQWLHPKCKEDWNRKYMRDYQQEARRKMKRAWQESTPIL